MLEYASTKLLPKLKLTHGLPVLYREKTIIHYDPIGPLSAFAQPMQYAQVWSGHRCISRRHGDLHPSVGYLHTYRPRTRVLYICGSILATSSGSSATLTGRICGWMRAYACIACKASDIHRMAGSVAITVVRSTQNIRCIPVHVCMYARVRKQGYETVADEI
ncbi:hypothetical protein BV20DRAFT_968755 [Pilatotrama ljubarskyi]|nr:hypothetical protein BV20DRAFT_968755 [Pilatotrama ljubarskyi]